MSKDLIEGVDFHWEEKLGVRYRVFTEEYILKIRTICCDNNCPNCPFKNKNKKK